MCLPVASILLLLPDAGELYFRFLNSHTKRVLDEVIDLSLKLLPYLLVSILVSALIKKYFTAEAFKKVFSGRHALPAILLASLLGVVSPLGSYVVIPLSAALVVAGMPFAPVLAFTISSPLINPGLFMLTLGTLGPEMAWMRCVSAVVLGTTAGLLVNWMGLGLAPVVREGKTFEEKGLLVQRTFLDEAWRYTRYISKYFFLGIFIAALTKVLIPVTLLSDILGSDHVLSIFAATLAGVPFYTCGGAELPVIQQLAELGADKGAILAYFISGPATKVANVTLVFSIYKKQVGILYFVVSLAGAILMGLLYHCF